jgi:hypothetical protein
MSDDERSDKEVTFYDVVGDAAGVVARLGPKIKACKTMLEEMEQCLQTAFDINEQANESARAVAEGKEPPKSES